MAFVVAERLGRRFLPLAVLLRLNLVFPDRAPSRFSVALRSTSVRKLQQWVREARETDDAAELAEKVVTLASALNTHDRRTRGHCERTRALTDLIVEELHLSATEANEVRWGAFLHDVGKLAVPSEILNKAGTPTSREWEILKSHPEAGARLVEPLRAFLSSGVDAVGSHHENYDGTGYPAGLSGEHLPRAARIVSVADAFEVMTAVRAYKRPMTMQAAREELARRSGTQFDPVIVRAFLNVSLGRLHWVLGVAAWITELPLLSIFPRLAAQVSTLAGGGAAVPPIGLPGVAAVSLGAMAVIGHVDTPKTAAPRTASAPAVRTSTVPATRAANRILPSPAASGPTTSSNQNVLSTPPALVAPPAAAVTEGAHIDGVGGVVVDASVNIAVPIDVIAPRQLVTPVTAGPLGAVTAGPVGAVTSGPLGAVAAGPLDAVTDADSSEPKVVDDVQGVAKTVAGDGAAVLHDLP
jgi:hypothetical protein